MKFLSKPYWSPYYSGILIGLLQIPIFLILHASVGASGSFNSIACLILNLLEGSKSSSVLGHCFPALKNWWQLAFVIGIFIGAYLSSTLGRMRRKGFAPVWTKALNITSLKKRVWMAFLGGFVLLLGARIADGCTSGNGLSGMALLSVGSIIVIGSMFVGGMLFVRFYKKI